MTEDAGGGGASLGSAHTQQPGVTPEDLGAEPERVSPDDLVITSPEEVAAPAATPDDSTPTINADLVDDPEELARTIREATGEPVEVVSESDQQTDR